MAAAMCMWAGIVGMLAGQADATSLPNSRGYELVSPASKNGGDVMPYSGRTRVAVDGSAVSFTSLTGFGDVRGTGISTEYMSVRTGQPGTQGWSTHAITPPQKPLTFFGASFGGFDPLYDGEFSDDLSRGIFLTISPLTADPIVQSVRNLYVRDDLRAAGTGTYRLATPCPGCAGPLPSLPFALNRPTLAGASSDMSHVLFESATPLTSDAPPGANLYESQGGTVRLAGILPGSACGSPPCIAAGAMAGQGAINRHYTPHTISEDGSRIFFTDPATGNIYMRIDHSSTVQINASERTPPDAQAAAQYQDATPDGSRVFFTTSEQLTNEVITHPGDTKLYMYDATPDALGHHLTLLSNDLEPSDDATTSDTVNGVIGTSADGRYVYFITSSGQLVPGAPTDATGPLPGQDRIYLWHDGALAYIGAMPSEEDLRNLNPTWALSDKQARVTPDGRHVLFLSTSGVGLTGYDHGSCPGNGVPSGGCRELYVYSADTQTLACASCNPTGAAATADATDYTLADATASGGTWHLPHALSDDGRFVFFNTREALVPEDVNGKIDAYEYDTQTKQVHLLSSGKDASDSFFLDASPKGADAFIDTREQLVGWDNDGNYDLYDVRVNGGLPDPVIVPECSGDACHGQQPAAPGSIRPGTSSFSGSGNSHSRVVVRPHKHKVVRCKRGQVRKKVHGKIKCVKRRRSPAKRAVAGHGRTK